MTKVSSKGNPSKGQQELLLEAQRTTHAVRAIARFLILQVTYSVAGTLLVALGALALTVNERGSLAGTLIFGGVATIVAGLIHSLQAGWNELGKSNRYVGVLAPLVSTPREVAIKPDASFQMMEGTCECTKWERGSGNVEVHEGVQYCGRCNKALKS